MTSKAQQREATIGRLLEIARDQFSEKGYADAATEDIVRLAGVTRGALYHHFGSKEGLFLAALDAVQRDVGQRVDAAAGSYADSWEQLAAGCAAFLAASRDPQVQRIMLIDAPAVLGWAAWREIDRRYSMKALREALEALASQEELVEVSIDALTHLLSGAMNEAALWIAQSNNPTALDEAVEALQRMVAAFRQR
ncbi:MAG: TetR/AcrR family transcriptional regulator [Chloroflexi bacterium]|nr:TetR/AcrR family transcriptional regulator [Chloroflexota bacterium]